MAVSDCTTGSSAARGATTRERRGEPTRADKEFLDQGIARVGAVVGGRNTYEAAEAWGGHNPLSRRAMTAGSLRSRRRLPEHPPRLPDHEY